MKIIFVGNGKVNAHRGIGIMKSEDIERIAEEHAINVVIICPLRILLFTYKEHFPLFFLKYSKNSNITFQSAKIVLRNAQGCNRNSEGHVHMTGCVKTAKKHVNFAGKVRLIFKQCIMECI